MNTRKVLIVDDEPNIVILIEQTLEILEEEYEIELLTAKNGLEAWEIIQCDKPGLVFLDVMMPVMSGLDVCQKIKAHSELQDIYVVMLTAKGQELDRQNGLQMGADRYMTKPFRPKDILEASLQVLNPVCHSIL